MLHNISKRDLSKYTNWRNKQQVSYSKSAFRQQLNFWQSVLSSSSEEQCKLFLQILSEYNIQYQNPTKPMEKYTAAPLGRTCPLWKKTSFLITQPGKRLEEYLLHVTEFGNNRESCYTGKHRTCPLGVMDLFYTSSAHHSPGKSICTVGILAITRTESEHPKDSFDFWTAIHCLNNLAT